MSNKLLAGKVAIITGASGRIGRAVALEFVRHGANVTVTGRSETNLAETVKQCQEITEDDQEVLVVKADLTDDKEVPIIIEKTVEHFNKLDILVNNAGVLELGSIENTSLEQYDRVMNVNLRSVFYLTQLAVPHLIKSQGNIVNVSSLNGMRAFPGVLSYCLSKSALDQFNNSIALDLAKKNVRVNCVNPGVIVTDLQRKEAMNDEVYQKFLERSKETHPLGRTGNPEEVAAYIRFLASSEAGFVTGSQCYIDGGRHLDCA